MKPEISIIIPTYNRRRLLSITIEKIINGTFPKDKYEIIISIDGSNDGTIELIQGFQAKFTNIFYISNKHTGSPAYVRNQALKKANGEIIAFIDDDVEPDFNWLKTASEYFSKYHIVGLEGNIKTDKMPNVCSWVAPVKGRRFDKGWYGYYLANMFYQRDVLERIKGLDEEFSNPSCEDIDLAWRSLEHGEIKYAQDVIVLHPAKKLDKTELKNYLSLRNSHDALLLSKHPLNGKIFIEEALPYKFFRMGVYNYMKCFFYNAYSDKIIPRIDLLIKPTLIYFYNQFTKKIKRLKRKYISYEF